MVSRLGARLFGLIGAAAMLAGMADPPAVTIQNIVTEARAARERQDYAAYLAQVRRLVDILPGNPSTHYSLARGQTLTGDRAAALATLNRLAELGFSFDAANDPALEGLRSDPGFAPLVARFAANGGSRGEARPPFALGMAGQQPEGVAHIGDDTYLVGTLRGAIYRVAPAAGAPRQIADAGASVVGIRPDPASGTFLACVGNEGASETMVQRRRLADGSLVASYPLPATGTFCNDITLVPGGFVATDSNNGVLYRLDGDRLVALPIAPLVFANGIAADSSGRRIYVATGNGVMAVDLATHAVTPISPDRLLGGIDGMVWHEGALYAVQGTVTPPRLLRITPAEDGSARVEALLSGHAQLAGATTVALRPGEAVVLSQTGIPNGTQPDDPILLRVPF